MILRLVILLSVVGVGQSLWDKYYTKERLEDKKSHEMCLPSSSANSMIYCGSKLIEAVNYLGMYNDSKTFVDSPLKTHPTTIITAFDNQFGNLSFTQINRTELQKFLDNYFLMPTTELIKCQPDDWTAEPTDIMKIQDKQLRDWAIELNNIWKDLCREIDPKIKSELDRHSILWVDNKFIIPGGRFREFYYWDTFWIVKGLLISGMRETAKGMARNLASMVERFNFVPNGGRIYYNRSQPPMLSPIVYAIYEETGDIKFVKDLLPILEKEFQFWEKNRKFKITTAAGKTHEVYFYRTGTFSPRPESMREDLLSSKNMTEDKRREFFQSVASAAESGWDFGSRWFADQKTLTSIETANIAPIDLNSYMCYNMDILHYLHEATGNRTKASEYERMHAEFQYVHDEVFYNDTTGAWYDFNARTSLHNVYNNPSIATPLFTNCYDILDESKPRRLFQLLLDTGFFNYSGGIPTSLIQNTSQQWDFPNGWAPLQHMIIEGLRKSSDPSMQDKAYEIAVKWIHGNYKVFSKTKHMYEKYNVIGDVPEPGGGGEYNVQTGFGWSNGIILDLLSTYYDRIEGPPVPGSLSTTTENSGLVLPALAVLNLFLTLI